jgi:siroheme synthase-like protein
MEAAVPLFPVVLKLEGQACLVVGGGRVAARKAASLLTCGGSVTLVAPEVDPVVMELAERSGHDLPGSLVVERRSYRSGEAGRFRLVVTATGVPAVDGAVAADAHAAGVWVNAADDVAHCSAVLPSVHRDQSVLVAVSTGGASPALATWLRRRIADQLGPDLGILASLLESARQAMKAEGRRTTDVDWQGVLDGPLPELVRAGRVDEATALLAGLVAGTPPSTPT